MRDETNNGITLKEAAIKRVYGETIFERGMDYFEDERVTNVIKLKNTLIGEVMGSAIYKTQVDLDNLGCDCSCPYGTNCKHGVAVLLQYFNEEFNDGDEVMKRLDGMNREELRGVIDKLISMNPSNLMYLDVHSADDEKSHEIRVEALDKQIKSKLKRIEYSQADAGFVDDFARLIKVNEDVLTKEQIFEILEFLVDNCEEYGYFYDDYSDSYYGDEIFENLCDAFVKKQLEERDFEKLNDLSGRDDYDMLSSFFYRLSEVENPANLKDFEGHVHEFLDEDSYVKFLINCGLIEKAERLIESNESLGEESRFRLYLRIDKGSALEFGYRKGFYSSLIRYYHEIGAHDEAVRLFREVVNDEEKRKQLKDDLHLYRDIFDSITKSEKKEGLEEVLRSLFERCYSLNYYGLCVDAGMKLDDKRLLRELMDKKTDYYFDVEDKIRLLEYLKDEYREDAVRELKGLANSLIKEKENHSYKKAVECVFLLRRIMSKDKWDEYAKGLYEGHSRKINLWSEFTRRGVYLKKRMGAVTLEDKGYDIVKRR